MEQPQSVRPAGEVVGGPTTWKPKPRQNKHAWGPIPSNPLTQTNPHAHPPWPVKSMTATAPQPTTRCQPIPQVNQLQMKHQQVDTKLQTQTNETHVETTITHADQQDNRHPKMQTAQPTTVTQRQPQTHPPSTPLRAEAQPFQPRQPLVQLHEQHQQHMHNRPQMQQQPQPPRPSIYPPGAYTNFLQMQMYSSMMTSQQMMQYHSHAYYANSATTQPAAQPATPVVPSSPSQREAKRRKLPYFLANETEVDTEAREAATAAATTTTAQYHQQNSTSKPGLSANIPIHPTVDPTPQTPSLDLVAPYHPPVPVRHQPIPQKPIQQYPGNQTEPSPAAINIWSRVYEQQTIPPIVQLQELYQHPEVHQQLAVLPSSANSTSYSSIPFIQSQPAVLYQQPQLKPPVQYLPPPPRCRLPAGFTVKYAYTKHQSDTNAEELRQLLQLEIDQRAAPATTQFAAVEPKCDCPVAVGFDLEWKPSFKKGQAQNDVALMQLSTTTHAFLFQIIRFGRPHKLNPSHFQTLEEYREAQRNVAINALGPTLTNILLDKQILKVGAGVTGDVQKFLNDYGLKIESAFDLSEYANARRHVPHAAKPVAPISPAAVSTDAGVCSASGTSSSSAVPSPPTTFVPPRVWGLASLTSHLLNVELAKPKRVRMSNWENQLNYDQQQYAAIDAYVSLAIFDRLHEQHVDQRNCVSALSAGFGLAKRTKRVEDPIPFEVVIRPSPSPPVEDFMEDIPQPNITAHRPPVDLTTDESIKSETKATGVKRERSAAIEIFE